MAGALSMDDKLLGEKMHYYCSSSEDEYESCEEGEEESEAVVESPPPAQPPANLGGDYSGTASNCGPKGVINDWRRFKQLETEKRAEQQLELIDLQKKLSLTCRSHLDDEKEKTEDERLMEELEGLDDDFMKEYRNRRMEEMKKIFRELPDYGTVEDLASSEQFLEVTEKSHPLTLVIIHVYEPNSSACSTMNGCIQCLSQEYSRVRFCKITAHDAKLSRKFSEDGVPALLAYKGGQLVGNLIALSDTLGDDFHADDVASLLIGHGLLTPGKI